MKYRLVKIQNIQISPYLVSLDTSGDIITSLCDTATDTEREIITQLPLLSSHVY